jgi:hypothetical protein
MDRFSSWSAYGNGLASTESFWRSAREVVPISFLLLSFVSWEDALLLLCPWFSHEVFYTVISLNEAPEETGAPCFLLCVSLLPFSLSSVRGEVLGLVVWMPVVASDRVCLQVAADKIYGGDAGGERIGYACIYPVFSLV